ncbi:MAG: hypothetical protein ACI9TI_002322, partial [Natronomonas sp.]
ACSLLGFDNVSDHSSLTGIRWYALALSLLRPLRLPFPTPLAVCHASTLLTRRIML